MYVFGGKCAQTERNLQKNLHNSEIICTFALAFKENAS